MAKKEKRAGGEARLDALFLVGDARQARAEARRLLSDPAATEGDRRAAQAALARSGPERAAAIAAATGLALFLAAALLGLLSHR